MSEVGCSFCERTKEELEKVKVGRVAGGLVEGQEGKAGDVFICFDCVKRAKNKLKTMGISK
jgi:hypothetical protein